MRKNSNRFTRRFLFLCAMGIVLQLFTAMPIYAKTIPTRQIIVQSDKSIYIVTENGDVFTGATLDEQTPEFLLGGVKKISTIGGNGLTLMNNGDILYGVIRAADIDMLPESLREQYAAKVVQTNAREIVCQNGSYYLYISNDDQLILIDTSPDNRLIIANDVKQCDPLGDDGIYLTNTNEAWMYTIKPSAEDRKLLTAETKLLTKDAYAIQAMRGPWYSTVYCSAIKNNGDLYFSKFDETPSKIAELAEPDQSICFPDDYQIYYVKQDGDLCSYNFKNNTTKTITYNVRAIRELEFDGSSGKILFAIKRDDSFYSITTGMGVKYQLSGISRFAEDGQFAYDTNNNLCYLSGRPTKIEVGNRYPDVVAMHAYIGSMESRLLFKKSNGEIWAVLSKSRTLGDAFLTSYGQKPLKIFFGDTEIKLTQKVHNVNGRTMYPFRECLESMGATVSWDAVNSVAIGELNGITIEFPIGKSEYRVNGVTKQMDTTAYIDPTTNRTYIPLRFAAEGLGFTVDWKDTAQQETITIR